MQESEEIICEHEEIICKSIDSNITALKYDCCIEFLIDRASLEERFPSSTLRWLVEVVIMARLVEYYRSLEE